MYPGMCILAGESHYTGIIKAEGGKGLDEREMDVQERENIERFTLRRSVDIE